MTSSPTSIRVRPVRETDLDLLADIARSLMAAPRWPRAAYARLIEPGEPRRIALVGEARGGGEIAGFAVAVLLAPEAEIETVAVASRFQRLGIGSRLLRELLSAMRGSGITLVHLEVRASNRPARALYRQAGFSENARRPGYYADPVEDAVIMSLHVGGHAAVRQEG